MLVGRYGEILHACAAEDRNTTAADCRACDAENGLFYAAVRFNRGELTAPQLDACAMQVHPQTARQIINGAGEFT